MFDQHPDELRFTGCRSNFMQAVNLYAVPAESTTIIAATPFRTQDGIIQSFWQTGMHRLNPLLQIEIYFNHLFITVEKNGKWLMLKSACYQTPEDVLYTIRYDSATLHSAIGTGSCKKKLHHTSQPGMNHIRYQFSSTDLSTHTH